jgi:hypothetical protein
MVVRSARAAAEWAITFAHPVALRLSELELFGVDWQPRDLVGHAAATCST